MKVYRELKNGIREHQENKSIFSQLNKDNQKYLTDFIRFSTQKADELCKDDRELTIYSDIIEAQKNNLNAEKFFGISAKELAEQMVKELPNKNIWKTIIISGLLNFIAFSLISLLLFRSNLKSSDYWSFVLFVILGTFVNSFLRIWISRLLIEKSQKVRRNTTFAIQILVVLLLICGLYLLIGKK